MGEMTYCNRPLLVQVRQERAFVIDSERKYAVLVGHGKQGAKDGAVRCLGYRSKWEALVW